MYKNVIAIVVLLYSIELREILVKSMEIKCDECRYNPKHFFIFNLTIVNNNIYAEMGTRTKISYGFKIYVDIEFRMQKSKRYNSVFKSHIDICRVLMSLRNSLYKKWVGSVLMNGNFSDKCPTLPGYYYLKRWTLRDDLIPAFMFSGDYRILLHGYYGRHEKSDEDMFMHCVFNINLT